MFDRFRFSMLMLVNPNKHYAKELRRKWANCFITSASFGCGWAGVFLSCASPPEVSVWEIMFPLLIVTILISFLWAIPNCYKSFKILGIEGGRIELVIGDMLKDSGDMVIPANTFFDTSSSVISKNSIQGKLVDCKYNGKEADLCKHIDAALEKARMNGEIVNDKIVGRNVRYPLNSILTVSKPGLADAQRFYLVALCDFNSNGDIIKDRTNIHQSINCIWTYLGNNIHVRNLCIPVLGSGLASKSIPQFDIIELIVDTFLLEVTKLRFTDVLRIYIYPKGTETFTAFHLAGQYIQHRVDNLYAIKSKADF